MLDIRVSDVKAVGTAAYTGEDKENILFILRMYVS